MVEGYPYGLGGWGVTGVFKEAGRIQIKFAGLLAPFILAFVLPTALLQLLEVLGIALLTTGFSPFLPPGPHAHNILFASATAAPPLPPPPTGRGLLVALAVGVILWLLSSLAVASIAKAVQYIYSEGEDPSAISSIFKTLPGAILRILVTTVWVVFLTLATAFVISIPFVLLAFIFKHAAIIPILQQLFVTVGAVILGFLFLLAPQVAVLEERNYGLAALKRSTKLVEEKLLPAFVLFVLSSVVGGLLSNLSNFVAAKLAAGKLPPWTAYILAVVFAVVYLVYLVYLLLVTVVLYFSTRAKYDGEEGTLPVENPYSSLVVPAEE